MTSWGTRIVSLLMLAAAGPASAGQVPARFPEGIVHGFLVMRGPGGKQIAQGHLRQIRNDGTVTARMMFRFDDGSIFDETVLYEQDKAFSMQEYHLVRRGPAFPYDMEIAVDRPSGRYTVKTWDTKGKPDETLEGKLDLPNDTYNGLIFTVTKNLRGDVSERVHYVVFTPEPKLIEVEIVPAGRHKVTIGKNEHDAIHYVLKPKLGALLQFFAKLTGKMPPDQHVWVYDDEVPAFVRYQGPLVHEGPVWSIELTSPEWTD
jgi:hypothetical protein